MKKNRAMTTVATAAVLSLGLAACGGGGGGGGGTSSGKFNAAADSVVNKSDKTGGTLRFANSGDWDSTDGADTYYGYSWNFIRNYGRALTMFKTVPGASGLQLTGDLAEGLGTPSDGAK